MNTIDTTASTTQDAARTYVQNANASRAAAALARNHAARAHQGQHARADSVSLSDTARAVASAREAVQNAPDVREQKVSAIKMQVSDGTYQVSSRMLASKMLGDS